MLDRQDPLGALLQDRSFEVRRQAIRGLRNFEFDQRLEIWLFDFLDNRKEHDTLRREILISLAPHLGKNRVRMKFLEFSRNARESPRMRATAIQLLSLLACNDTHVQFILHGILNENPATTLRKAAAWALFTDIRDHKTRQLLVDIAKDSNQPASVRVEAIKSLYFEMEELEVKNPILDIARNASGHADVRVAAIRALIAVHDDLQVRHVLSDAALSDENPRIRKAALEALGSMNAELARFFHLPYYGYTVIDNLEY